mmetsp:Transcript_48305/g.121665  ORF Transcript_48305/g.121665 Transcript_48305/m.121665 type:complete len:689 (+) Transcript_48305:191-2257(+)
MASSSSASKQLVAGLVLHRSEVIAHSMDTLERKGDARTARGARRKGEGFGGFKQPGKPFQPLGAPQLTERLRGQVAAKLQKEQKQRAMVVQNVGAQHHETKTKRNDMDIGAEWSSSADPGNNNIDAEDGKIEGVEIGSERASQQVANLPHGLYGKDLPRCQGHHRNVDGSDMLRHSIRHSEMRVQRVKFDSPAGFDINTATLASVMPVREHYPSVALQHKGLGMGGSSGSSAEVADSGQPLSARPTLRAPVASKGGASPPKEPRMPGQARPPLSARGAPPRPPISSPSQVGSSLVGRAGCAPVHKLSSLSEFISSSGAGGGNAASGLVQSERANAAFIGLDGNSFMVNRVREQVEKLLGYGVTSVGSVKDEKPRQRDAVALRKGQDVVERWKRTEKMLEKRERELWEKSAACKPEETQKKEADVKKEIDAKKDGEPEGEELRIGGAEQERPGSGGADPSGGAAGVERTADEGIDGAADRRRKRAIGTEETSLISLRSTLHTYQDSREKHRLELQDTLHTMETNRPNAWRKHAALGGSRADAKNRDPEGDESMQVQLRWYHGLLVRMQEEKGNLPGVVHFVLDTVKVVLEHGEIFGPELLFATIAKIDNSEIDRVVAALLLHMVRGMEGVTRQDLVAWFEHNRSEVPKQIRDAAEKLQRPGAVVAAEPELAAMAGMAHRPSTVTFVTAS